MIIIIIIKNVWLLYNLDKLILFSLLKNINKLKKFFISKLLLFKFIQFKFFLFINLINIIIGIIKKNNIFILCESLNNSFDAILDT